MKPFEHPYFSELEAWEGQINDLDATTMMCQEAQMFLELDKSPALIVVQTKKDLKEMAKALSKETEVAIDLEHHD